MKENKVIYEVKLEKSVKIILCLFALGIILNAISTDFPVKEAFAQLSSGDRIKVEVSGSLSTYNY